MVITLRPLRPADTPALALLNDAAVPAVNGLGLTGMTAHLPRCALAVGAVGGVGGVGAVDAEAGDLLGFLLAVGPGADYPSENYAWFSTHRPGSLYVDRIVVAPAAHGRGIGRALYSAAEEHALAVGLDEITCEVNLEPPNPGSLAFHHRLGFTQVGEQSTTGGTVRVALMARPVARSAG